MNIPVYMIHIHIHIYNIHIHIHIHTHIIHTHTYIHTLRMGTRLQHDICSHVYSPYLSTAKGSQLPPLGSSTTAGPPRKQPSCRSCESPVVVSESKSPQYQQGTYISERISDSQVISRRSPTEPTSG